MAVSVYTATLKEAVAHHALGKQKNGTAKATRNRNCPTWNQGDFSLPGPFGFKSVVISATSRK
jgi:hypothetical protein